jgi:histidinol-phosphate aminotransferase
VIASREHLSTELKRLGFEVFPSSSNFVLVRHPGHAAETLYLELKTGGILVRYFNKARIDNCLRISIGTDDECYALIAALKEIMG